MAPELEAPRAFQASGGYTVRRGSRPAYLDVEGIFIDGRDEVIIRDTNFDATASPRRPNVAFNQVNSYTNDGRSRYSALVVGLNSRLAGGHIVSASYTLASKRNIA